jgi:predicted RNA-binding protein with PUA-like domain
MAYWLLKSEPGAWSWNDQIKAKTSNWDGVRNYQAANNLKAMRRGDCCFFYHSVDEKRIVGVVEVVGEYRPDPSDDTARFGMVVVKAVTALTKPIGLSEIKSDPALNHLALVRQSRLSVMPIDSKAWRRLCHLGGITP